MQVQCIEKDVVSKKIIEGDSIFRMIEDVILNITFRISKNLNGIFLLFNLKTTGFEIPVNSK